MAWRMAEHGSRNLTGHVSVGVGIGSINHFSPLQTGEDFAEASRKARREVSREVDALASSAGRRKRSVIAGMRIIKTIGPARRGDDTYHIACERDWPEKNEQGAFVCAYKKTSRRGSGCLS